MAAPTKPERELGAARYSATKRWIFPILALVFGIALVLPPLVNINRYHRRIADSISHSIGRPVRLSSVKLHLLPRPGFEISGFIVDEDPAFGVEPILRASDVTAYVRLVSLWRGRLEIARISFDEPSLNLVRNLDGRWNFASILTQASQNPNAPTAQRHASQLPRFPYIEATNARINLKSGDEKLPFSFVGAGLSAWLANPGEWRVRFEAQPVRTDLSLDLADTGSLRLEGSLRKAASLGVMPIDLHAEWVNAPLGQISRILTSSDSDWRGDLRLAADLSGSIDHAAVKIRAEGRRIHRVEFEPGEPLDVDATCQGEYAQSGHNFDQVTCLVPAGEGHLLLTGSIHNILQSPRPALLLELNHVPVASAIEEFRLIRSGFAPGIQATGLIDGRFTYGDSAASSGRLQGSAVVSDVVISAPSLDKPVSASALHFAMSPLDPPHTRHHPAFPPPAEESALLLAPVTLGSVAPLTVDGRFARSGFSVRLVGRTAVQRLAMAARTFGVLRSADVAFAPQGMADLDMTIHGPWLMPIADPDHPLAPLAINGTMHLRNAQLTADFLSRPLQIATAQAVFSENHVVWSPASVSYGPIHADATLSYPLYCESVLVCTRHFALRVPSLDAAAFQSTMLGPARSGKILQQLLTRLDRKARIWPSLTGTVQIGTLTLHQLAIRDVSATLSISGNTAHLDSFTGHALDGSLYASGGMQFVDEKPQYSLETQLDHTSAAALAALFHEQWGPGSIDLTTHVDLAGFEAPELAASAKGTFHWNWSKGGLAVGSETGLDQFDQWIASGTVSGSSLLIEHSEVIRSAAAVPVTGSISFAHNLSLSVNPPDHSVTLSGTLAHPKVDIAPVTAAETRPR